MSTTDNTKNSARQNPEKSIEETAEAVDEKFDSELALDGVIYVDLPQAGHIWRLGSVSVRWREKLPILSAGPGPKDISVLASMGLWLGRGDPPSLAVVCCGLGNVWPHMGRKLYDNFPAARAGMDRVAAAADWDILALMDEPDAEKISHTRWQQPYLFLLEYAQWSQFAALGLNPALLCGHSLGELVSLCLAGIYTPEVAWHILDTRAMQMAEMEARSTRENGMMAVHADVAVMEQLRETWPGLIVSNYNTPRQFIVSGSRDALMEARKSLRKQRIPAIVLNVSLAYHHPGMRILRDLSLRRLNALPMQAPCINVLSGVTADFYPVDQPSICRCITDLDESPVRWTDCVRAMYEGQGISYFLELGPQDTLCGLITDNEPLAICLPAGRKGRETEQMRLVCARLHALGNLPRAAVSAALLARRAAGAPETISETAPDVKPASTAPQVFSRTDPRFAVSMQSLATILAKAAACPVDSIKPETDLRYDLSLRSSRFPLLAQEIEEVMGVRLLFENLLGVTCVGDLAHVVCTAGADTPPVARIPTDASPERNVAIEAPRRRRFVEVSDISTLVFLSAVSPPSAVALDGSCHFSRFADPALAAHIVRLRADMPCLPVSYAMQALVEGACMLFPQLAGHGLSDVRFYDTPLLPPGVTRECSITVKAQAKFTYDCLMTQMCRADLFVQDITQNGRRAGTISEIISGTVHMTAAPYVARPLWPASPDDDDGEENTFTRKFYDALGLTASWRLLTDWAALPGGMYRAGMAAEHECARDKNVARTASIAKKEKSRYTDILCIVEGIVQAAFMAVAEPAGERADSTSAAEILAALRFWRLDAAGFVFFNTLLPMSGARRIQMRKSWDDGTTQCFDAQVSDVRGQVLVTMHHLKFFCQE